MSSLAEYLRTFLKESETEKVQPEIPPALLSTPIETAQEIVSILEHASVNEEFHQGTALSNTKGHLARNHQICLANLVAEICKDDAARSLLTESSHVIEKTHEFLHVAAERSDIPLITQCLRAIGNICYNNDSAREKLRTSGGVQSLAAALTAVEKAETLTPNDCQQEENAVLQQNLQYVAASGSILNATGDSEALQKELVAAGVINNLMWLLARSSTEREREIALNALLRFSEIDDALKDMVSNGNIGVIIKTLEECDNEEDADGVSDLIRAITKNETNLSAFAAHSDTIPRLVRVAQGSYLSRDKASVHTQPERAQVVAAHCISVLLADDQCLANCCPSDESTIEMIEMLLSWTVDAQREIDDENDQQSGSDVTPSRSVVDRAVIGLVGIGNICRSHTSARLLGSIPTIIDAIIKLTKHKMSFVQHAALNVLNNFVKFPDNKTKAIEAGAVECLLTSIHDPQPPLQYLACSSLRILSSTEDRSLLKRVVNDETTLLRLEHLAKSEVLAVRSEAMRVLAAIVKHGACADIVCPIVSKVGVQFFLQMLSQEHVQLKTEATIALAIIATLQGECRAGLLSDNCSVLKTIMETVQQSEQFHHGLNFLSMCGQLLEEKDFVSSEVCQRVIEYAQLKLANHPETSAQLHARQFIASATAAVERMQKASSQ
eukprot:gene10012-2186_t